MKSPNLNDNIVTLLNFGYTIALCYLKSYVNVWHIYSLHKYTTINASEIIILEYSPESGSSFMIVSMAVAFDG